MILPQFEVVERPNGHYIIVLLAKTPYRPCLTVWSGHNAWLIGSTRAFRLMESDGTRLAWIVNHPTRLADTVGSIGQPERGRGMEYSIENWKHGRFVIVAQGQRKLVVCDSKEHAQRLLRQLNDSENAAAECLRDTSSLSLKQES
jgi:hypothetical protein